VENDSEGKGEEGLPYNHIPIKHVLWMGCFVSASPTSIFMEGFTKTTETPNQRGSLSTIQTQNSLNAVCDYKASTTSQKSGGENSLDLVV
jgi:hypothetical protein